MRARRVFAALALLLLLPVLAGCHDRAAREAEQDGLLIGFSQMGSESGWRIGNTNSVMGSAERAGVRLMYNNANQSQEKQIKAIRSYIVYQADVIVFSPIVEDGWDTVLSEARDAGIPVIVEDRAIHTDDETLYACHIGSDFYREGTLAAEYLLKKLDTLPEGRTLNVVEIEGTLDSSPMLQRRRGFRDRLADEGRLHFLDRVSGDFMTSKGEECMRNLLSLHGDGIDVVYSHNDAMTYGAIAAIEERGLVPGKDIIMISVDAEQQAIDLLRQGKINCVVECDPMQGDKIMETAMALAAGEAVEKEIRIEESVFTEFDDLASLPPRGY